MTCNKVNYRSSLQIDIADPLHSFFNKSRFMSKYSQHLLLVFMESLRGYRKIAGVQDVHFAIPSNRIEIFKTHTKNFERFDSFFGPVKDALS